MLSRDLINLGASLTEAVRTGRVTAALVADAVLQLSGMVPQAMALEQNPLIFVNLHDDLPAAPASVEMALALLRQAVAREISRDMARAS